jgi:hypothetical protein
MRRRRVIAGAVAGLATAVAVARRRRRERIELYYDDGSMVELHRGSAESDRLLALSEDALDAVRAG